MYINLRHRPLGDQDREHIQLHNTIHLTLYINRLLAYSYEPGLIRFINLQPTYLRTERRDQHVEKYRHVRPRP